MLLLATLAFAQDPAADDARARELYENGALLYEEGRYEDAIAAWREAYRLSDRPVLLFNMANAAERIGDYDEAMRLLSRYRAYAPAEERETLDRRIRNIERRLDEQRTTSPAATVAPTPTTPAEPARDGVRILPVVLLGAGGLGLAGGGAFAVLALDARADALAACTTSGDATWCTDAAADPMRRDKSWSLAADVGFVVGGLAAAGGVGALLWGPQPVSVGAAPVEGGAVVTVAGAFR